MDVEIKEVNPSDWEQIVRIGVATNEADVIPMLTPEGQEAMRASRTNDIRKVLVNPRCTVLKAEVDHQIVGYIACGSGYYIVQLYVAPPFQGYGIGTQLIDKIITTSESITIELKASLNAVGFYTKLGFSATSEQQSINGIQFVPMALNMSK